MGKPFVLFLLLLFLLAPASAGTIPASIVAAINLTNFTFAADLEADTFSARDYGIAINDSYLDVNTTYFLTVNITNFTIDAYNFTANSSVATNPTTFTAKMRNPAVRYNLKVNGVYSREVLTDSYGNATFSYNTWGSIPVRFLLATCLESWSYTDWSACSIGSQSHTGTDANSCGTSYNVSEVVKSCSITATSSGGGGSGSFSEGTPSMKSLAFSFPTTTPILKILATVFYTLPEDQNITVSYPASISLFIPPTPGLAYSFIEIAPTFNSSKYLTSAQIDFKVNKTWYSKNEIVQSSTALLRFDGQYWRYLPTVRTGEDQSSYSFSANTTTFSLFAITGTKRPRPAPTATAGLPITTITATPPVVPTSTTLPIATPTISPSSKPLAYWALPIVLLSILAVAVYLKKSKPPPVKPGTQVTIKGVVTCHTQKGFEITDGTGFILVQYKYEPPPVSSWVIVEGTFLGQGDQTYIAASSVKEIVR